MCPGTRVANATSPGPPTARYSVINNDPPPATRLIAPKKPPPPACCVCVVICTSADIHESSPASEITASLGPRANSNTGMVVPRMRCCIIPPKIYFPEKYTGTIPHSNPRHALIISTTLHETKLQESSAQPSH